MTHLEALKRGRARL